MGTSLQTNGDNERDKCKDYSGVVGAARVVLVSCCALLPPFRSQSQHELCGPRGYTKARVKTPVDLFVSFSSLPSTKTRSSQLRISTQWDPVLLAMHRGKQCFTTGVTVAS